MSMMAISMFYTIVSAGLTVLLLAPSMADEWSMCSTTCGTGHQYMTPTTCEGQETKPCKKIFRECSVGICPTAICRRFIYRYKDTSSCCKPVESQCGKFGRVANLKVVGGDKSKKMWPWMVWIVMKNRFPTMCGGTLIARRWVVTAGSCMGNAGPTEVIVQAGSALLRSNPFEAQLNTVSEIRPHPGFDFPQNDIALLKMHNPFTLGNNVQPACLPNGENPIYDEKCVVLGWGTTTNRGIELSETLTEAQVYIYPNEVCDEEISDEVKGSSRKLCAGVLSGGVDTCMGDGGGPLLCQRKGSCLWYLAGIVSIGPSPCGQEGKASTYTKVSSFESWIRNYVN